MEPNINDGIEKFDLFEDLNEHTNTKSNDPYWYIDQRVLFVYYYSHVIRIGAMRDVVISINSNLYTFWLFAELLFLKMNLFKNFFQE